MVTAEDTPAPAQLNTSGLKTFAQEARRQLLEQIGGRLDQVLAEVSLARRENQKAVAELEEQLNSVSREQLIEQVAYTWFNRFCALRFMDVNLYTRLGTVSAAEGFSQPEILADAKQGVIDDEWNVDKERVLGLLDNSLPSHDAQGEAYRLLLVAVCNRHHELLPFLFEAIADYTELLLPADLLSDNSVLTRTCEALTPEACQSVEVIGWLYQFYISEKKDEVIGKVVASEDIPAATQLFTPNWIVKYMVQNSLGAQWLATYPGSPLKGQMEYYIEPAEQTDEVNAQLAAITPASLNPEELTLIDPASGSGHILVEAYELFKAIYLERGYRQRDVPELILEKNLFGLDIDERAAQLTGFALMMKGRSDDRRLFERGVKLNVMALVDSAGFDAEGLAKGVDLSDYGLKPGDLTELKRLFEHATTFGSLIQVPEELAKKLPALRKLGEATSQDLFVADALKRLAPLVQQAELLASQYDAVVANPPYMGSKLYAPVLRKYVYAEYKSGGSDLYGAFTLRNVQFARDNGSIGMITIPNWMFLSSFDALRSSIFQHAPIARLVDNGRGVWGSDFGSCSFVLSKAAPGGLNGRFLRLFETPGSVATNSELERRFHVNARFSVSNDEFQMIPGAPVAYWASYKIRKSFADNPQLGEFADARQGLSTCNNNRFLRFWHEVDNSNIGFGLPSRDAARQSSTKWFPYNKGGAFRRWSGNRDYVVNWQDNGREIHELSKIPLDYSGAPVRAKNFYFRPSVSWSDITISHNSFRVFPAGFIHGNVGHSAFGGTQEWRKSLLAFCNNKYASLVMKLLSPSVHFDVGYFKKIPYLKLAWASEFVEITEGCVATSTEDWDAYEHSWDFQSLPLLTVSSEPTPTLESSYTAWTRKNRDTITEMKGLEEENNRLFIDAYGLADELTPDVPIEQITLTVNPAYRYGGKLTEEEQWTRFRQDTMAELVSYAVGCMMGRYSLDKPGLVLANTGETLDDYLAQVPEPTFLPDDDNVIPLLDGEWFPDEISERFKTFLKAAFGTEHYEQNLTYLEDGLFPANLEGKKRKTIRDYFLKDFYKHHISTYKKRPIYWLFSSPKGTFGALVYLHRYRPDTVSVVLGYLRDFQAKLTAKLTHLQTVADSADASQKDKTQALKEINNLRSNLQELEDYERDVLYPLATEQAELDLDDGVKVNYNKLGTALRKVTGLSGK